MNVRIIEVGPRDGLQNEAVPVPTGVKVEFIKRLADAGCREIEATSFVSPKWVPQLGDAEELWPAVQEFSGVKLSALVPNMRGLQRAVELGVDNIAVFTATSESFTKRNINMSVAESLSTFGEVIAEFKRTRPLGHIRGYVSTAFECPYEGRIAPERTVEVAEKLIEIGCQEISIGDTIGVAAPAEVRILTPLLLRAISQDRLVYHFHDTRGTAIANVAEAVEQGITAFDSSAAGLGGCPYAKGAGGNLATEDLAYFLERSGVQTGLDLQLLARASLPVLQALGRHPFAKAQQALLAE